MGNPKNVVIKPFIHNMPEVLAGIDLVVSRAGATTLAEITSLGIPSILSSKSICYKQSSGKKCKVFK